MALIDEVAEVLLLLLTLRLDRVRCAAEVLLATVAAVVAFAVRIPLFLAYLDAFLMREVVLSRADRGVGLVVGAAALNALRLCLDDSRRVLRCVYSCIRRCCVGPFDGDMSSFEHQTIGRHQLGKLVRWLIASLIDLDRGTGRHAGAGLILLVKSGARMAKLPIVDSLLNQHLTHGQTCAMLAQPLAFIVRVHLGLRGLGLVGVVRLVAAAVAAVLAQTLLRLAHFLDRIGQLVAVVLRCPSDFRATANLRFA